MTDKTARRVGVAGVLLFILFMVAAFFMVSMIYDNIQVARDTHISDAVLYDCVIYDVPEACEQL